MRLVRSREIAMLRAEMAQVRDEHRRALEDGGRPSTMSMGYYMGLRTAAIILGVMPGTREPCRRRRVKR